MSNDGFLVLDETDLGSKARARMACDELPNSIARETRWRLRLWWYQVLETAKALCPVDTGTLWLTIRVEEGTPDSPNFEMIVALPQDTLINMSIVAGGLLINPKTGRICDYAQAVHEGHFIRSGNWIPPRPFLSDAMNMHQDELYRIIDRSMEKSIDTVWVGE
jgi:hypothetical protein